MWELLWVLRYAQFPLLQVRLSSLTCTTRVVNIGRAEVPGEDCQGYIDFAQRYKECENLSHGVY